VSLDVRRTRGFLTARGGENSHAAILARAFGIPAVSGIEGVTEWLSCGTEVLINGLTGEVIIWPGNEARATVELAPARRPLPDNGDGPVKGLVVMANISSADEVTEACAYGAEGVGLYRTEFEFLTAGVALTEEMQYERYAAVVKAMQGKPVTIRLLDIGGDKELRFLDVAEERNPSLGCRGARFLIARPEFLAAQARALARASRHGPVNVLYPMIASHAQFMTLKRMFMEAIMDIEPGELYHGVLFEVPAACLEAAALLRDADFGSIGTNDLVQYLYAVDRNNERVAKEYEPDQPVIWSLIRSIAETARELGKPLAICGELGGDPRHIAKVIEHGVSAVSTNARSIPGVRAAARAAFTDT